MAGKLDQDAAGNEILRISGGKSVAGRPFWRRGAWLATVWVLGQRRWLEALGPGRGARRGGGGGGQQKQKEEVTLEDVCRLAVELSEINNQRSCEISELLNDTKNHLNSWTAHQTSDDEEDDGAQGDDENDVLVLFDSLGKQLKTFQRNLTSTDKKVENAKKTSSPLRKRRRKRR